MILESIGSPENANSQSRRGNSSDFSDSQRLPAASSLLKDDLNKTIESMWRAGFARSACERWVLGALERAEQSLSKISDPVTSVGILLVAVINQLDCLDENRSTLGKIYLFNSLQSILSSRLESKALHSLTQIFEGTNPAGCYEALKALSFCSTALRNNQPFPVVSMLSTLEVLGRQDPSSDEAIAAVSELYESCERTPMLAGMGGGVLLNEPRHNIFNLKNPSNSLANNKFVEVGIALYENLIAKDEPFRSVNQIIGELRGWMQLAERYSESYQDERQRTSVMEIPQRIVNYYLKYNWSLQGVFSEVIAPPLTGSPSKTASSKNDALALLSGLEMPSVPPIALERYRERLDQLLEQGVDLRLAYTYLQEERVLSEPEWQILRATSEKKLFEYHNGAQKTFAEYLGAFSELGASAKALFNQKAEHLLDLIKHNHFSRLDEVASAFEQIFEAVILTDAITPDSATQEDSMRKLSALANFDDRPLVSEDPEKAQIIKDRTFKETIRVFQGLHRIHHGFSVFTDSFRSLPSGAPCDFIRFAKAVKGPSGEFGYLNSSTHTLSPGRGFFMEGIDISRCFYAGRGPVPYQDFLLAWPEHAKAFQLLPKLKLYPIRGLWILSCDDPQMRIAGVNMALVIQNEHAFRSSFDFSSSALLVPSKLVDEFLAPYRLPLNNESSSQAKYDPNQRDLTKSALSLSQLRRLAEARGQFTVAVSHAACIGGGLCQGFPINRSPFHRFENELTGVRVRDAMGHPHKIQIGLQNKKETTLEINKDLQDAHDAVYATSETYLRLFDLFNLTFAAWSRGALLNSPKSDSLMMIDKCLQYHLAILDRKIDHRRIAEDVPLLVFRNPINTSEIEGTFIDPADLSLNQFSPGAEPRKVAYFNTDRNDHLDSKSLSLWQSRIVGTRFNSWYTWPVMMNRREYFESMANL